MAYSKKLLDYFENPRFVGELARADTTDEVSNPIYLTRIERITSPYNPHIHPCNPRK